MVKRSSVWFSMFLVGVLLVLLPLGSFLYLKAGISYRIESLGELKPLGSGDVFGLEKSTEEDPAVYALYMTPASASDSVATSIRNVHEAFDHEPAVNFVGLGMADFSIIKDKDQTSQLPLSASFKSAFQALTSPSPHCENVPLSQQGILVDREGMVRRCYDLHSGPDVTRMVEHLTILVPPAPIQDMFLEREKEY
ncbi:MAG: hypothetical protein AB8F78_01125 [Saprospiraceae bacterium]